MNTEGYRVIYEPEDSFWWYVGMRSVFLSLLDGHHETGEDFGILDAGCGTGAVLGHLRRYGEVIGLDISVARK